MKVYEAMAEAFIAEGADDVFGMMGDANMHWANAMVERGASVIETRHEGSGLTMADGWARRAGRPGIGTTTCGPGVTQLATALVCASRARTPLVIMAGEAPLNEVGDSQYLDQRRFAAAVETEFVQVATPAQAQSAVRQAFYLARTQSRPVMVSAPMDVQQEDFNGPEYFTSGQLIDVSPVAANPTKVEEAAEIIRTSSRVVVLLGKGAQSADSAELVLALQERTKGLLATTLQTKNWLRDRTPYHVGISGGYGTLTGRDLLRDADCLVAVGTSLSGFTTGKGDLYPNARVVQLDNADSVTTGIDRPVDCYVRGDALASLAALLEALGTDATEDAGFHTREVLEALGTADDIREPFLREPGLLDPREVVSVLDRVVPDDVDLVLGSGHQTDFGIMLFGRSRRIVCNYGLFGAIGQAPLLTMGWSLAGGHRPTFVVEGDASFTMHLAEFDTACRYGWPVLVVVMNDQALGAEYHKSAAHGLEPDLSVISSPDLAAAAMALGGKGVRIESVPALEAAVAAYLQDPSPTVLDVRITREVVSVPFRRLWKGEEV